MKERQAPPTTATLLALLLLAAALPAGAELAKIENAGDALIFHPLQEAKEFTLTVAGPCDYTYSAKSRGEIAFKLPPDALEGAYAFNLKATPIIDPRVMEILRAARGKEDENGRVRELCRDGKLPVAQTQSGAFSVLEGKIVFDPTPESQRKDGEESK